MNSFGILKIGKQTKFNNPVIFRQHSRCIFERIKESVAWPRADLSSIALFSITKHENFYDEVGVYSNLEAIYFSQKAR